MKRGERWKVTVWKIPEQETTMGGFRYIALTAGLSLAACTSNPNAPVNQTFPVRQLDQFFGSLSPTPAPRAFPSTPQ